MTAPRPEDRHEFHPGRMPNDDTCYEWFPNGHSVNGWVRCAQPRESAVHAAGESDNCEHGKTPEQCHVCCAGLPPAPTEEAVKRPPCRTCDLGYDDDPNEVCTCGDPDPAPPRQPEEPRMDEYDELTRIPEEMSVGLLNRVVRALRERLYQANLKAQTPPPPSREPDGERRIGGKTIGQWRFLMYQRYKAREVDGVEELLAAAFTPKEPRE